MKLKYTGKDTIILRRQNSTLKLNKNQTFEVTKKDLERFKDRPEFKKVK